MRTSGRVNRRSWVRNLFVPVLDLFRARRRTPARPRQSVPLGLMVLELRASPSSLLTGEGPGYRGFDLTARAEYSRVAGSAGGEALSILGEQRKAAGSLQGLTWASNLHLAAGGDGAAATPGLAATSGPAAFSYREQWFGDGWQLPEDFRTPPPSRPLPPPPPRDQTGVGGVGGLAGAAGSRTTTNSASGPGGTGSAQPGVTSGTPGAGFGGIGLISNTAAPAALGAITASAPANALGQSVTAANHAGVAAPGSVRQGVDTPARLRTRSVQPHHRGPHRLRHTATGTAHTIRFTSSTPTPASRCPRGPRRSTASPTGR